MSKSHLRLLLGLMSLPAILLQDNLVGIALQVLLVIILAVTHGRRFRLLPNLILLISVSSAHLLQPNGLHLASIGGFPITAGALMLGARKALVLVALLYLSHYMVTGRPRFPGKLGTLISMQFFYVDRITTGWHSIHPKRPFIGAIDRLLLSLEEQEAEAIDTNAEKHKHGTMATPLEIWANVGYLCLIWALYLTPLMGILPTFR